MTGSGKESGRAAVGGSGGGSGNCDLADGLITALTRMLRLGRADAPLGTSAGERGIEIAQACALQGRDAIMDF